VKGGRSRHNDGNLYSRRMSNLQSEIRAFRRETLIAIDAVERGLEIAQLGTGATDVTSKGGRDLVTATDVAVEDSIRHLLTDTVGLPVVGEERGGKAPAEGSPYWLLDPICGTRNFASGLSLYCVNLALVEDGQVTIAVVGDPSRGEITVAELGRGAWTDGARRRVTTSDESRTVVVDDGKSKGDPREHAARFIAEAIRADRWDLRSLGSTLAFPYLAAGRVSAYVVFWESPALHAAAGTLIATEAGGTLSDIDGRPWTTESNSVIAAANSQLHAELVELARRTAP
jgi:myo-inositol-1(or 4)-monophosphatase